MENQGHLERILGIVCSVFDAYTAVLFLQDKNESIYRVAAKFSLGDIVDTECVVRTGKGIVGRILENNQPLLINNFDRQKSSLEYYGAKGEANIKAFMGCMLRNSAGALCLDSKRTFSFSEKDQKILHLFAELIYDLQTKFLSASRNENDSRYYHCLQHIHGLRKRLTRWSAFLENFLLLLAETTGFDYCFLAVRDEKGKTFYLEGFSRPIFPGDNSGMRFDVNHGLVGWVFRNNAPVIGGEREAETQSAPLFGGSAHTSPFLRVICQPLHYHRKTRAVLGLANEKPIPITEQLKLFTQFAAGHLELFLENLYIKSQLHSCKTQLQKGEPPQP